MTRLACRPADLCNPSKHKSCLLTCLPMLWFRTQIHLPAGLTTCIPALVAFLTQSPLKTHQSLPVLSTSVPRSNTFIITCPAVLLPCTFRLTKLSLPVLFRFLEEPCVLPSFLVHLCPSSNTTITTHLLLPSYLRLPARQRAGLSLRLASSPLGLQGTLRNKDLI